MELTLQHLKDRLEEKLKSLKKSPHTFMARVIAVNQLLMASAWYECTLWDGSDNDLKLLERIVVDILWAGQKEFAKPRVDLIMLTQPKKKGVVGLIPFVMYTSSKLTC